MGFPPEPVPGLSFNPKTVTFISELSYVAATRGAVFFPPGIDKLINDVFH